MFHGKHDSQKRRRRRPTIVVEYEGVPKLYPDQFTAGYWDRISHIWKPRDLTPRERERRNLEVIRMLTDDLAEWLSRRNPFE